MTLSPGQAVKYRGIAFELGDLVLVVPPLPDRLLEKHAEHLDALLAPQNPGTANQIQQRAKTISEHLRPPLIDALKRNYSDFKDEDVQDFINAENWAQLVAALIGTSVLPKTKVGEMPPDVA